jgi:hypothetical protein
MKPSLILSSSFFGIALGSIIGIAQASVPTVTSHQASPAVDTPVTLEIPSDPPVITLRPVTIVASRRHVAPKRWTCGAFHDMLQGPVGAQVKDCSWK